MTGDTEPASGDGGPSLWIAGAVPYPAPTPDGSTAPYWEAAAKGELLIKRCDTCGRAHFYPRPFCPVCWSTAVRWERASGRGTVYTFSVVRRSDLPAFRERVPYVPAIVELAEGPRMMTTVVGVDPAEIRIGMAVEVAYAPAGPDGSAVVPVFRPAAPAP